jgi:protein tyrosine phosphatase (PTP) superfamily phosphohydrolase (DUF442 family)
VVKELALAQVDKYFSLGKCLLRKGGQRFDSATANGCVVVVCRIDFRDVTVALPRQLSSPYQGKSPVLRMACLLLLFLVTLPWGEFNDGNQGKQAGPKPRTERSRPAPANVEAPGLHNVYRITDRLYSGSSPDREEGFRSLRKLGVKTIISVDGAKPDVDSARKYGMRYVHLPFGYDGIPRQRVLELAKAVRVLPGPCYIHCHHGKHRGPAAAAALHLCLDEKCSVEQAVAEMRRAGTDPHYTGLYAVPKTLIRPNLAELDRVAAHFPQVAEVCGLAQAMVEIDARWDNLKRIQAAGWKAPTDHADLDPPHEALQVVEHYREASRLEQVRKSSEQFKRSLTDAEERMSNLERVLRGGKKEGNVNRRAADEAFAKAGTACTQCHTKYRDAPDRGLAFPKPQSHR